MAVVENRFVCDLLKPVQAQALKGNVFSLDNLGSRLSVLIYNNGQPATISGSVTANCILPDGSTVNVNGGLTTENGGSKAYVDIPQSCLLIPGILKIAIKCTSSSVITTLAAIVANVYMTKTDNVITPSQQIINDWNTEISAAIATQNAAIANQDTKINDLKSAFAREKFPADNVVSALVFTQGGYYGNPSGNFISNADWGYTDLIPCVAGKTYYLNLPANQYINFYDANKDHLASYAGLYKTAPENAAYIRLGVHKNRQSIVILTVDGTYMSKVAEMRSALNKTLGLIYDGTIADFSVSSGGNTSHNLISSIYLPVGTYTIECVQSATLTTIYKNTFGYKKVGASGYTYEDAHENYNLSSGKRSWTINITETDNYQFIMWIYNPSADVTYSDFFLTNKLKQDKEIEEINAGIAVIEDDIAETNENIPGIYDGEAIRRVEWEKGDIETDGKNKASTTYARTKGFISISDIQKIHIAEKCRIIIHYYAETATDPDTATQISQTAFGSQTSEAQDILFDLLLPNVSKIRIVCYVYNGTWGTNEEKAQAGVKVYYRTFANKVCERIPLYEMPSYFDSNVASAISAIEANMQEVGRNGETFIFITDMHWGEQYANGLHNRQNSPSIVQKLVKTLPINTVICGGDLIDDGQKTLMLKFMYDCVHSFASFLGQNFLVVKGNHDSNQNGISDESQWISNNEYYGIAMRHQEYGITEFADDGYNDYYRDNPATKTRYIFIDTGYEETMVQAQLDWLTSVLEKDDGYRVLIAIHAVYENTTSGGVTTGEWRGFTTSLFEILDSYSSKVFGIFAGHTHTDEILSTPGGIPVVITDTDSMRVASASASGTVNTATAGTYTEQCMDVITVNYTNGKIKCVRVGRGNSRTIPAGN